MAGQGKLRIAIVGGGASGTLAAIHLLKNFKAEVEIHIFDSSANIGEGKAYQTRDLKHLLNVPASKMGIEGPKDKSFEEWALKKDPALRESPHWPFVPRAYFAEYLKENLRELSADSLVQKQDKILSFHWNGSSWALEGEKQTYRSDYIFVCTGYGCEKENKFHPAARTDFSEASIANVMAGEEVFILGSGLSAVDGFRSLYPKNVKITFLSRHGFMPRSHTALPAKDIDLNICVGLSPLKIFQLFRLMLLNEDLSPEQICDNLRRIAPRIWTCWSDAERSSFFRHLKPLWEVYRHRIPASVLQELKKANEDGTFECFGGRISTVEKVGAKWEITFTERGTSRQIRKSADHIFQATGSKICSRFETPYLIKDRFGFGYEYTRAENLYLIGPPSKGIYWESTALEEIRDQVKVAIMEMKRKRPRTEAKNFFQKLSPRLASHLKDAGEDYRQHAVHALGFSLSLLKISSVVTIHALCPWVFESKASNDLRLLGQLLSKRRVRDFKAPNRLPIEKKFRVDAQNFPNKIDNFPSAEKKLNTRQDKGFSEI